MKRNISPRIPEYTAYKQEGEEFILFKTYRGLTYREILIDLIASEPRQLSVDSIETEEDQDWFYLDISWSNTGGITRVMTYGRSVYRINK